VNDVSQAFLGIIAVSTALMAIMQVGAIIVLARVARQVRDIIGTLQQDIRPLIARANAIADEASKTAALATVQAQKIDRLVTDLTHRFENLRDCPGGDHHAGARRAGRVRRTEGRPGRHPGHPGHARARHGSRRGRRALYRVSYRDTNWA